MSESTADLSALCRAADVAASGGSFDEGVALYEVDLRRDPENPEALFSLAGLFEQRSSELERAGDVGAARRIAEQASKLRSAAEEASLRAPGDIRTGRRVQGGPRLVLVERGVDLHALPACLEGFAVGSSEIYTEDPLDEPIHLEGATVTAWLGDSRAADELDGHALRESIVATGARLSALVGEGLPRVWTFAAGAGLVEALQVELEADALDAAIAMHAAERLLTEGRFSEVLFVLGDNVLNRRLHSSAALAVGPDAVSFVWCSTAHDRLEQEPWPLHRYPLHATSVIEGAPGGDPAGSAGADARASVPRTVGNEGPPPESDDRRIALVMPASGTERRTVIALQQALRPDGRLLALTGPGRSPGSAAARKRGAVVRPLAPEPLPSVPLEPAAGSLGEALPPNDQLMSPELQKLLPLFARLVRHARRDRVPVLWQYATGLAEALDDQRPAILVVPPDWTAEARVACALARARGIPTLSLPPEPGTQVAGIAPPCADRIGLRDEDEGAALVERFGVDRERLVLADGSPRANASVLRRAIHELTGDAAPVRTSEEAPPSPPPALLSPRTNHRFPGAGAVFEARRRGTPALRPYFAELWRRRAFVFDMARANVKGQYADTRAGKVWLLLNPILLALVYYFLVAIALKARTTGIVFLGSLLAGLFAFYYTRNSLLMGSSSVVGASALVLNSAFPRLLLPLSACLSALFVYVPMLVVFAVFAVVIGLPIGPQLAWVPVIILLQTGLNVGIATIGAVANVLFRDFGRALPMLTRLWLYLSPVLWSPDQIPDSAKPLVELNPLYPALAMWHEVLIDGEGAKISLLIPAAAWAVGTILLGVYFFLSREHDFAGRI